MSGSATTAATSTLAPFPALAAFAATARVHDIAVQRNARQRDAAPGDIHAAAVCVAAVTGITAGSARTSGAGHPTDAAAATVAAACAASAVTPCGVERELRVPAVAAGAATTTSATDTAAATGSADAADTADAATSSLTTCCLVVVDGAARGEGDRARGDVQRATTGIAAVPSFAP